MRPDMRLVLQAYDVEYHDRPNWHPIRCLNPDHDDAHASASINLDENAWKCHGCGAKGSSLDVIMLKENCDYKAALARAQELTGDSGEPVRVSPFSGRRVPGGPSFKPRYQRPSPARRRPFSGPGL